MARYANPLDRVNAKRACEIRVMKQASVINVTFLPVLSIMIPSKGDATAENAYGMPKIGTIYIDIISTYTYRIYIKHLLGNTD